MAPFFASSSAFSFPWMFTCAGTQQSSMLPFLSCRMFLMRVIHGWLEFLLATASRTLLESLNITFGPLGQLSIAFSIANASALNMVRCFGRHIDVLRLRSCEYIPHPTPSSIFEPSVYV